MFNYPIESFPNVMRDLENVRHLGFASMSLFKPVILLLVYYFNYFPHTTTFGLFS